MIAQVVIARPSGCEVLRVPEVVPPPPPPPATSPVVQPPPATPLAGAWRGTITGSVANQSFSLPLILEIGRPAAGETNPVHLSWGHRCR